MPIPPRRKPDFPDHFDRRDELQEYQLTAAQYQSAKPETVERYTRRRWDKHWSAQKRQIPPGLQGASRETLLGYFDWDCFEKGRPMDPEPIHARVDLEKRFRRLKAKHGDLICDAAAGVITIEECAKLLCLRKSIVSELVTQADDEARELLEWYRSQ